MATRSPKIKSDTGRPAECALGIGGRLRDEASAWPIISSSGATVRASIESLRLDPAQPVGPPRRGPKASLHLMFSVDVVDSHRPRVHPPNNQSHITIRAPFVPCDPPSGPKAPAADPASPHRPPSFPHGAARTHGRAPEPARKTKARRMSATSSPLYRMSCLDTCPATNIF